MSSWKPYILCFIAIIALTGCANHESSDGASASVPAQSNSATPTPTHTSSATPTPTQISKKPTGHPSNTSAPTTADPTKKPADALPIENSREAERYLLAKEFHNNSDISVATIQTIPDAQGETYQYAINAYSQSIRKNGGSGTLGTYLVSVDGNWGLTDPKLLPKN